MYYKHRLVIYYYLDIEKQIHSIFNKIKYDDLNSQPSLNNELTDIKDGTLYKSILSSEDGESVKKNKAFTLTINTDGISICKKSKLTIWPVYLVINELPIQKRFSIDNVIIAGTYIYINQDLHINTNILYLIL